MRQLIPWLPVAILAAYLLYLKLAWTRFTRAQAEMKDRADAALDAWLREREDG